MEDRITQVRKLSDADLFAAHLRRVGAELRFDRSVDSGPESPLAQPITVPLGAAGSRTIGNRLARKKACVLSLKFTGEPVT